MAMDLVNGRAAEVSVLYPSVESMRWTKEQHPIAVEADISNNRLSLFKVTYHGVHTNTISHLLFIFMGIPQGKCF